MEETIKKIMLEKYPNGEQFYINNKEQFEEIWKQAQKKQQIWDLYQMIDVLKDDEYSNEVKIHRIEKQIEGLK